MGDALHPFPPQAFQELLEIEWMILQGVHDGFGQARRQGGRQESDPVAGDDDVVQRVAGFAGPEELEPLRSPTYFAPGVQGPVGSKCATFEAEAALQPAWVVHEAWVQHWIKRAASRSIDQCR